MCRPVPGSLPIPILSRSSRSAGRKRGPWCARPRRRCGSRRVKAAGTTRGDQGIVTQAGSLQTHLFSPGPKRILALDGGGVRGIISLAYLERLETILRDRFGPDTVLADYFDLIGGASTGAIIATGLAL